MSWALFVKLGVIWVVAALLLGLLVSWLMAGLGASADSAGGSEADRS